MTANCFSTLCYLKSECAVLVIIIRKSVLIFGFFSKHSVWITGSKTYLPLEQIPATKTALCLRFNITWYLLKPSHFSLCFYNSISNCTCFWAPYWFLSLVSSEYWYLGPSAQLSNRLCEKRETTRRSRDVRFSQCVLCIKLSTIILQPASTELMMMSCTHKTPNRTVEHVYKSKNKIIIVNNDWFCHFVCILAASKFKVNVSLYFVF